MENFKTARLIAAAGSDADMLYASGFNAADEFIYYEADGQKNIVVSVLEYSRAVNEAKKDVRVIEAGDILRTQPKNRPGGRDLLAAISRYAGVTQWLVPARFPLAYAERLRAGGIRVEPEDGDFFPERAIKNDDELAAIRHSERVTQDAMETIRDMIASASVNSRGELVRKNGDILTCEWIRSEIEAEFKRRSFTADRTIVACGAQAAAPHCIGFGPVRAGEPVVCDIFPRSDENGYWGDMTRTFCKGPAQPVVRRAFDAVKNAADAVCKMLRAGVTGADAHNLAAEILASAGFPAHKNTDGIPCGFIHGLGHGVGLDIHEQPRLSPANPHPLEPNAVVSVEPGLYDPQWGGIRLEDLVRITPDGMENFCTMEKSLEI